MILPAAAIEFPALCLHPRYGFVALAPERLTVTTRHALRDGMYDDLLVVSRSGTAHPVAGARKIAAVGPLGGWNIFLNQRIRVELMAGGEPFVIAVDDLRARVFESFRTWHGWSSAENFEEMDRAVRRATTVSEIIDALS